MKRWAWAAGLAAAFAGAALWTLHRFRAAHAPLGDAGRGLCVGSAPYTGYWQRKVGGLEYTDFRGRTRHPHPVRVNTPLKCVEARCTDGRFDGDWTSFDEAGQPVWRGRFERGRALSPWQHARPDGGAAESVALEGLTPWTPDCVLEETERAH